MVDQHLPHDVCGHPEEMGAILDAARFLAREAHVGFVDFSAVLCSVWPRRSISQIVSSQLVGLLVHQRNERTASASGSQPAFPLLEHYRDRLGRLCGHATLPDRVNRYKNLGAAGAKSTRIST